MIAMIGTWKMCQEGLIDAHDLLKTGASAREAVVRAVVRVEDNPAYCSVGYGGLPDRDGHVMTDAALMDGSALRMGGVISAENIKNPIMAANLLCGRETNCLLAGRGAELFAVRNRLPMRDMRTEESMKRWREAVLKNPEHLSAYTGHDTVCVLALDENGHLAAGVSTSGLFMKDPGRVGDSPVIGSGFYADDRYGAAAATGLGEDIMRGCLSYETVSRMKRGESPQQACEGALRELAARKIELGENADNMSLIALSPDGRFGAATTLPCFPFAAARGGESGLYAVDGKGLTRAISPDELAGVD